MMLEDYELYPSHGAFDGGPGLFLDFILSNKRSTVVPLDLTADSFTATVLREQPTATSEEATYVQGAAGFYRMVLDSSQAIRLSIYFPADIFDTDVTAVRVAASDISSIQNAQWRIPIPH